MYNKRLIVITGLLILLLLSLTSSAKHPGLLARYRIRQSGQVVATAYNSLANQTDSTPWITAAGTRCRPGVIAANFLPLGTKVYIEGFEGVFVVEDRMNRRYAKRIDIWFRSYSDAMRFGKRKIRYYVLDSV